MVLGIPAVPEKDERQAGCSQRGFGVFVIFGETGGRGICVKQARVGKLADIGRFRGIDDVLVLGSPVVPRSR